MSILKSCAASILLLVICLGTTVGASAQMPDSIFVIGSTLPDGYDFVGKAFHKEGSVFRCEDVRAYPVEGNPPVLYFVGEHGSKLDIKNCTFLAVTNGSYVDDVMTSTAELKRGALNSFIQVKRDYIYTIEFDFSTSPATFRLTRAKDAQTAAHIPVSDTQAVYYSLLGLPVDNPSGGIFICVKDGKATRVRIP